MAKKYTVEEIDEKIEALKEIKRKKIIEQKKKQAIELKNKEIESNRILRTVMRDFLKTKGLCDDDAIISLGVDGVKNIVFGQGRASSPTGAQ